MPPRIPSAAAIIPKASPHTHCKSCLARAFSSTPQSQTRLRRHLYAWLAMEGQKFRNPVPNTTNYLTDYNSRGERVRAARDSTSRRPARAAEGSRDAPETADSKALEESAQDDARSRRGRRPGEETKAAPQPFPLNPHFVSQSVLSESLRHEVWKRVQVDKKSVRQVSVELGVEMRRVGAVVRLYEVERRMKVEGATLAIPYAEAIHSMIPTTPYDPSTDRITPHETINDLPHHSLTNPQLFYPTSESRAFNRVDAGRVFSGAPRLPDSQDVGQGGRPTREPWQDASTEIVGKKGHEVPVLKAADARIPHPHLIAFEKDRQDPALRGEAGARRSRYYQRLRDDEEERRQRREDRERREEAKKTRIDTDRWQFVVTDVKASREGTGLDGRGDKSVGLRYGMPLRDRKRGEVKIPTKVEI